MRTTITVDEDLANALELEMRRSGDSLEQVVNRLLRAGVECTTPRRRFRIESRSLGVRQNVDYSKTSELLDLLDDTM